MASLLSSLLRCPSSRLSLSFSLLSRHLSPPLPLPTTSHLFSTSQPNPTLSLPLLLLLFLPYHQPKTLQIPMGQTHHPLSFVLQVTMGNLPSSLSLYVPSSSFPSADSKFRLFFLSNHSPQTTVQLLEMAESESELAVHRFLFLVFAEFFLKELQSDLKKFKQLKDTADLTKPYTWHPFARAMKRKVFALMACTIWYQSCVVPAGTMLHG